ncbi:condensation domain-containing protein [Streptomyces sp. NPDC005236]|uniref:condensation domain-containing protein n=1 Tax=Streptomyces sp. NPDC005236 TaxID=3157028 RepID=UPI0033AAE9D7
MRSHHRHDGAVLAVVHEPPGTHDGAPLVLELCGAARADAEAVAARIARHHRAYDVELHIPQDDAADSAADCVPDGPADGVPDGAVDVPDGADGAVVDGAADGAANVPDGAADVRDGVPDGPVDGVPDGAADVPDGAVDSAADGAGDGAVDGGAVGGVSRADRPGRCLLRLTPLGPAGPGMSLTDDLLADLLAPPGAGTLAVSGHQRVLLEAALGAPGGPGRFVEQIHWDWTGPLDRTRFSTSWQSLAEREAVLRASFDWAGAPRLVLHDSAALEVALHARSDVGWNELLRRELERGFEPYRPGLLRVSLLEGAPQPGGTPPPARVLVTYHRALLDERGARLLVRQFYRSYLAGGVLPGADRRPDIRDHAHWLTRQDPAAAREFWAAAAPPAGAALSPARPGGPPRQGQGQGQGQGTGTGRIRRRLGPDQSARLRAWAGARGAGESSALHVVWALLLYRAAATGGPLPVAFGVHVFGRDMALRAAAAVPGLLGGPLPMTVTVDPAALLVDLLAQVRDAALDLSAYAWVSGEQVHRWSGRAPGARLTQSSIRFESHPRLPANLLAELAAHGIGAGAPRSAAGATTLPITLLAHHDAQDALVLGALYDRAQFTDTDAFDTLAQCLHLLRALPGHRDGQFTVADALRLLGTSPVPAMTAPPAGDDTVTAPALLRPGRPGADLVCLVTVPGVTPGAYDLFLRGYRGPERIVSLTLTGGQVPAAVLGELLGDGRRLTVCGAGPAGPVAHDIARRAARRTGPAPVVVMTALGGPAQSARALSRALSAVRARDA